MINRLLVGAAVVGAAAATAAGIAVGLTTGGGSTPTGAPARPAGVPFSACPASDEVGEFGDGDRVWATAIDESGRWVRVRLPDHPLREGWVQAASVDPDDRLDLPVAGCDTLIGLEPVPLDALALEPDDPEPEEETDEGEEGDEVDEIEQAEEPELVDEPDPADEVDPVETTTTTSTTTAPNTTTPVTTAPATTAPPTTAAPAPTTAPPVTAVPTTAAPTTTVPPATTTSPPTTTTSPPTTTTTVPPVVAWGTPSRQHPTIRENIASNIGACNTALPTSSQISVSANHPSGLASVQFRHRLPNGAWSQWSNANLSGDLHRGTIGPLGPDLLDPDTSVSLGWEFRATPNQGAASTLSSTGNNQVTLVWCNFN